jgi:hypothetical protein
MKTIQILNPTAGHKAITDLWLWIKAEVAQGNKYVLEVLPYADYLTSQQRKYYHKAILTEIASQVKTEAGKFPMPVWKEFYRNLFLGDEVKEIIDPLTGASKKILVRVSSESLSVKGYSELIEKVTAHAATEYGVIFNGNFEQWQANEG